MKRINAFWLIPTENEYTLKSFEEMLHKFDYIGFTDPLGIKYMIVTGGSAMGFAVEPSGTYTNKEDQKNAQGVYYIFKSKNELLEWMKD